MSSDDSTNKDDNKASGANMKGSKSAMKYAGLATAMFFSMLIAWYLGSYLDKYFENETEYIGLTFVMLTLFAYFYKLIKELA